MIKFVALTTYKCLMAHGIYFLIRIHLLLKIAPKRWRLEINFSQDAVLMLSSMNLPDGIQVCISAYLPCNIPILDR